MYFVLYDKNFKSIGKTYILESWSRVQRAMDLDDIRITGEEIPYSANPFFVAINNQQGKLQFYGLASVPSIEEDQKKTSLSLKDFRTLWKSELLLDWSQWKERTLSSYLDFIFSQWIKQVDTGVPNILWDLSRLEGIDWDEENLPIQSTTSSSMMYDLVYNCLKYYNIHCDTVLDISSKSIKYVFKRSGLYKESLRTSDFGVYSIEKSFGEYNRASVYDSSFRKLQSLSLTSDNLIVRTDVTQIQARIGGELSSGDDTVLMELLDTEQLSVGDVIKWRGETADVVEWDGSQYTIRCQSGSVFHNNRRKDIRGSYYKGILTAYEDLVYPAKNRIFVAKDAESTSEAIYDAVMGLSDNRYQENIDLNANEHKSILDLTKVDFSYRIAVYTEDGFYKDLPVGEIETDSNGKHIVRLGLRIQELTQEI